MLNYKVCHKFYITEGASPARTSTDSKLLQKQIADSSLYKIFPSFFGECYPFPYKILYSGQNWFYLAAVLLFCILYKTNKSSRNLSTYSFFDPFTYCWLFILREILVAWR